MTEHLQRMTKGQLKNLIKYEEDKMAKEVTKTQSTALTDEDELFRLAQQHAGLGQSDREEDRIQAWIKVLHQLSPELNRNEPSYAGDQAKPGDIWIAAKSLLIPGQTGFHFQQCGYQYNWVEWPGQPGSGGRPIARHSKKPSHLGGSSEFGRIDLPNGHQIIETRYHLGLVYADGVAPFPATISYSSTGAAVSTNWVNRQWAKRNPNDGSLTPSCLYLWHMVTKERSNDRGRWYLLMPESEIMATKEQYLMGSEVSERIKESQLKIGDNEGGMQDEIPF